MTQSTLLVLVTLLFSATLSARVIYGDDNRKEVYEASDFHQRLARSAAVLIKEKDIQRTSESRVTLKQTTLKEWLESSINGPGNISFCDGQRFVDQPNPGNCTGFLIAPDLLATAGHCAEMPKFCGDYKWVFDFQVDPLTKNAGFDVKEENIYKCKRVVSNVLTMAIGLDYAIVQLDRRVTDRDPLEIRSDGDIEALSPLFVVGSPSGLPLKIADGAHVRDNHHPFFFNANLDTFSGNSGSPVFNAITGIVEGILVRGEEDYVPNTDIMCVEVHKCDNDKCRGEDVSRMTSVPEIGIYSALNKASLNGDMVNLEKLLKLNTWIDFRLKDGQSALFKAIQGGQVSAVKMLLAKGADVNLQDALGNTPLHQLAATHTQNFSEILSLLVSSQADLERKNNSGDTALLLAARSLNISGVKLLLKAGADPIVLDANQSNILSKIFRK